jgi:hypothetical protein
VSVKPAKGKNVISAPKKVLRNEVIVPQDAEAEKFLERYKKKKLPRDDSLGKLNGTKPSNGLASLADIQANPPYLSLEDLKVLTNYSALKEAIEKTGNAALLKIAWDYTECLRELVEEAVRRRLWGDDAPEGQLRFNTFEKNGKRYVNAHIGNFTRSVPREDIEILELLLRMTSTRQLTSADHVAIPINNQASGLAQKL